jgi:hypothetical protein
MGAITLDGILRAEHEVLRTAFDEWLAMGDHPGEDLYWVMGVHDMAHKLIDKPEGKDEVSN